MNLTTRWGLALVNAKTFTGKRQIPGVGGKSMRFRGTGTVKMELTAEGRRSSATWRGPIGLRYANGPILSPAGKENLPEYVPLAIFRTEISKYDPQKGTMIDTPVIVASQFGTGRAIAISPHPRAIEPAWNRSCNGPWPGSPGSLPAVGILAASTLLRTWFWAPGGMCRQSALVALPAAGYTPW